MTHEISRSETGRKTGTPEGAATLIIGQRIHAGLDDRYRLWHGKIETAAARFPGFVGSKLRAPDPGQPDWTAIYGFDSVGHLQDWLNSTIRLDLVDEGKPLFDGPATAQVLAEGAKEPETLVTVVITHRVADSKIDDFLAWQKRVDDAEHRFPGFRGTELFRPIEGVQEEWTISYRFDTAEHLDAWLTSSERAELLAQAAEFGDFTLRRIDHSFGNWFSHGDSDAPPPSNFKTSVAVWVGLYPTVVFLTLMTAPLGMPLWLGMLIGNLLSSFAMSYISMPYYVNKVLGWWLKPRTAAPQPRTDLKGGLLILALNATWVAIFYLVTVQFWTLP
ncbi:antibiotic biosynthesis monooxygenase [Gordonia sp. zg691]|uniref:Antibiotic biosynthesis monooxygenase n=1 Tax=Gordonia jinghuaiqii TaxID=2758710 RepID=A0A7D7LTA7_9ACTN|nr:antibiotic biosynthesis monooxygenase [Gordonia jinghuaiqii]MBD0860177.1 antibiotic biosynthesis monooxygenase [Gordonia jinghuaiqii]MCR5977343.1 antibiotic biosynthesis monooxygenase [Gordonia jinghuaiqii]QMT00075.1 antibiotic biosynthesis monooxygenase [Gordonia jinghuaiqii]